MPICITRSINSSITISPSRKLAYMIILGEVFIIESCNHPTESFRRGMKCLCITTISISYISYIVWRFEMISECRLSETNTHKKTWIDPSFKCRIIPHIPVLEIRSCICLEKIFLTLFLSISLQCKFLCIFICSFCISRFFYDIADVFILILSWKISIVQSGCIEDTKWIDRCFIFPYFEMKMWSSRRWSGSRSSWSSSRTSDNISFMYKLILGNKYLRKMTIYRHISIWMFHCKI